MTDARIVDVNGQPVITADAQAPQLGAGHPSGAPAVPTAAPSPTAVVPIPQGSRGWNNTVVVWGKLWHSLSPDSSKLQALF